MAAWLTIYCTRPIDGVSPTDLIAAVNDTDIFTVAEVWGIEDEEVVRAARRHLTIEPVAGPGDIRFCMRYGPHDEFPIMIWVWDGSSAGEALELLGDRHEPGAERVRNVLERTVAVVGLPLKVKHQKDMGIVLASLIAEAFASAGQGLTHDPNHEWWAVEDGVPSLVLGRDGDA